MMDEWEVGRSWSVAGLECYGKTSSVEQPGVSKLQEKSRTRVRETRQARETGAP